VTLSQMRREEQCVPCVVGAGSTQGAPLACAEPQHVPLRVPEAFAAAKVEGLVAVAVVAELCEPADGPEVGD